VQLHGGVKSNYNYTLTEHPPKNLNCIYN